MFLGLRAFQWCWKSKLLLLNKSSSPQIWACNPWRDKVIQHFSRSDLFSGRKLSNICVQESLYSCISNPLISEEEFILSWFYFWAEGSPTALSLSVFSFLENICCRCFFWECIQTTYIFRPPNVLYWGCNKNTVMKFWYNFISVGRLCWF